MTKKDRIRRALHNADRPLSTNQVSTEAGCDWHTADKYLKELQQQGDAYSSKMSERQTLWWDREIPI